MIHIARNREIWCPFDSGQSEKSTGDRGPTQGLKIKMGMLSGYV